MTAIQTDYSIKGDSISRIVTMPDVRTRRISHKTLPFVDGTNGSGVVFNVEIANWWRRGRPMKNVQSRTPIRYAEFCAGVGGFRLGIDASTLNAKLVYANEIDAACARTYSRNFGRGFDSSDLLKLNPTDIPDFDMLCAGSPCQLFPSANGIEKTR